MNYVKVLLALEDIQCGECLEVMLDDGKALVDVPRSAKEDGHTVLRVTPMDAAFRMTIQKGNEPRMAAGVDADRAPKQDEGGIS
jgi:TusA-related sulfurtransferase